MPSEVIQLRDPDTGHFGKRGRRWRCDQCQLMSINGIVCHETGCPDEWKDVIRECKECGTKFEPQEREQGCCSPCCAASYYGGECECDSCEYASHPDPDRCRSEGCNWHRNEEA